VTDINLAYVPMDSFSGATDDDKLAAAMTYAAAQTYIPAIMLPPREITFATGGLTPYSGMRIIGPIGANGPKDPELGNFFNHIVNLNVGTGTSSWFNGTETYYDIYIGNIAFQNLDLNAQFWHQPPTTAPGLFACQFDSLAFYGFEYIFGNPSYACTMTQVSFTGHWEVVSFINTAMTLEFSDCSFWADSIGNFVISLNGGNSRMGMLYLTVAPGWNGINYTSSGAPMAMYSPVIEGTSATNATYPLLSISAGNLTVYNGQFDYVNPASGVNGIIVQSGGNLTLENANYQIGGAGSTFPFVYQTSGHCLLLNPVSLAGGSIYFRESGGTTVTASPGAITYN
jgi:hypothetical protein